MMWIDPTPINRLTGWPRKAMGEQVVRKDPCSFCAHHDGILVAKGDFWDLAEFDFVRCPNCDLVQADPMLSDAVMSKGCHAYYLKESNRESGRSLYKNRLRSFRRGVYFGLRLKRLNYEPKTVLEMGPGDGFFSRGVQYVYPKAEFHCVDIVADVIQNIKSVHGFHGFVGTLSDLEGENSHEVYDLIIARDIIEHLSEPSQAFATISNLLKPNGLFHFITPNGYEDIWAAYCTWQIEQQPSEVVLNHVNYFPAQALEKKLDQYDLKPIEYFIYDFNGTRWGQARTIKRNLELPISKKISAKQTIDAFSGKHGKGMTGLKSPLDLWWSKYRWLTFIYCVWKEHFQLRLNARWGIGHEIYGLFVK